MAVTPEISWDFHSSGVLSPAISGEEPRRVLRDWRVWGALQICGVTGGGEGVVEATRRVSAGSHTVRGVLTQDPGCFCRKTEHVIGADVYWNSTVDSSLEKSAAKRMVCKQAGLAPNVAQADCR